jgi:hypothetical protein
MPQHAAIIRVIREIRGQRKKIIATQLLTKKLVDKASHLLMSTKKKNNNNETKR